MNKSRKEFITKAHQKIKKDFFDITLFFTIIFLVVREGFEIALFSASISLFSLFIQNVIELLFGFAAAAIIGCLTYFAYTKFSIAKVYKITEYMIVILGAALFQTGLTNFLSNYYRISLSNVGSFHLQFLPGEDSFIGTLLQGFLGIDSNFSAARLMVMLAYIAIIYILFLYKGHILQKLFRWK